MLSFLGCLHEAAQTVQFQWVGIETHLQLFSWTEEKYHARRVRGVDLNESDSDPESFDQQVDMTPSLLGSKLEGPCRRRPGPSWRSHSEVYCPKAQFCETHLSHHISGLLRTYIVNYSCWKLSFLGWYGNSAKFAYFILSYTLSHSSDQSKRSRLDWCIFHSSICNVTTKSAHGHGFE